METRQAMKSEIERRLEEMNSRIVTLNGYIENIRKARNGTRPNRTDTKVMKGYLMELMDAKVERKVYESELRNY